MDLHTSAMINVMPQLLAKISQKFPSFPSNLPVARITRNFRGDVKKKNYRSPRMRISESKIPWAGNVAEAMWIGKFPTGISPPAPPPFPSVVYRASEQAFNLFRTRQTRCYSMRVCVNRTSVFEEAAINCRSYLLRGKTPSPRPAPSLSSRAHCTHRSTWWPNKLVLSRFPAVRYVAT